MKILVLQLARLGDIYLTWPTVRAIKRRHPDAEVHLLVRARFKSATEGLREVDRLWTLETQDILEPAFQVDPDHKGCLERLERYTDKLRAEKFDRIINLTFSSFSSYLTHSITHEGVTAVSGYTRHQDGFLSIPDDGSAYFYAQIGIGKPNRGHIAEIFAHVAGFDLQREDWFTPRALISDRHPELIYHDRYIVMHIAASERKKSYSAMKWKQVLSGLLRETTLDVVLIGGSEDVEKSKQILFGLDDSRIVNLVGQTRISELFSVIYYSKMLIGCDSGPIHIASLCNVRCLNLSFASVNFWETGPRAIGSRVVKAESEEEMASDRVVLEATNILNQKPSFVAYEVVEGVPCYLGPEESDEEEFRWKLVKALYMGDQLPITENPIVFDGLRKLREINEVFIQQYENYEKVKGTNFNSIVNRGEDVIFAIARLVPSIAPLISWYQTEKTRLGPMEKSDLLEKTLTIHRNLDGIIEVYLGKGQEVQNAQDKMV